MALNTSEFYWSHNGKYQAAADKLQEMIPASGSVERPYKNKKLEAFRKAANAYYDLYNYGGYNRAASICKIFQVRMSVHKYWARKYSYRQSLYDLVEARMNEIVAEAAMEQGIVLPIEEV